MEDNKAEGRVSLEGLGAKIDTLASELKSSKLEFNGRIDSLRATVEQGLTNVGERLTNVEGRLTNVEGQLTNVEGRLTNVESGLAKVQITVEGIDAFGKNVWDSLDSLRTKVADGFEEARKENGREFKLVHSAIRHIGEKVQRIEDAQARMTNHER